MDTDAKLECVWQSNKVMRQIRSGLTEVLNEALKDVVYESIGGITLDKGVERATEETRAVVTTVDQCRVAIKKLLQEIQDDLDRAQAQLWELKKQEEK